MRDGGEVAEYASIPVTLGAYVVPRGSLGASL